MNEHPTLLEANDNSLSLGVFIVGMVHPPKYEDEVVCPEDVQKQYVGDITRASALIALGIIQNNAVHGKQSILIHHRDTTIVFPKGYD